MPVTITKKTEQAAPAPAGETAYQRWYKKNKEKHNAKRRQKYAADEEYREKAKQSSADTRMRAKDVDNQAQA